MMTITKNRRASSSNVLIIFQKDRDTYGRLLKKGTKQISTYVKGAILTLKFYAMDPNIAMATSNMAYIKIAPIEASIGFADVRSCKALRCENAWSEERAKNEFIHGLPASNRSAVKIFRRSEQDVHLLKIVSRHTRYQSRLEEYRAL